MKHVFGNHLVSVFNAAMLVQPPTNIPTDSEPNAIALDFVRNGYKHPRILALGNHRIITGLTWLVCV
jgi:hypothetical protein